MGINKELESMNQNKIVVPLDGSELSERVLQYAKTPAVRVGTEVILLHVCDPAECHCEAGKCTVQPMHRVYVEHTAEKVRKELETAATSKINIGWEVLVGDPATQIINYATENNACRIIMAAHGRSGVGQWVLGSVAEKIARVSPIPVVIVRTFTNEAQRSNSPDAKILVLLDGSNVAEQVLPYAMEHADIWSREVMLLHVCEPPYTEQRVANYLTLPGHSPVTEQEQYVEKEMIKCKEKAKEYLVGIEKQFRDNRLKVNSEILEGNTAEMIVDYVIKNPFNLIAMTTHGRSGLSRWAFGSVADRVVHTASSPLLLVRPH